MNHTNNPRTTSFRVRGTELDTGRELRHDHLYLWRPTVVLALDDQTPPSVAVNRAARAAAAIAGKLHVVIAHASRANEEPATLLSRTCDRIHALVPSNTADVELRAGKLRDIAVEVAAERHATLVILSPDAGGDGATASASAERAAVPVLVAREPRPGGRIIAATNLADHRYPVLAASRDLARTLGNPLTYFHNAVPTPPVSHFDPLAGVAPLDLNAIDDEIASAMFKRLRSMTGSIGNVDVVVSKSPTTIEALLRFARERDVDIVTIGHRRKSWFGRLIGRHLARDVVDRCRRSVLVVPVEGQ